jgi:catechol 2,3-dioxygenase-like lactoylglutathione lyase family enzyme
MSRVQLALNVTDVDAAVEFYEKLFATPVAKRKPGYANFEIAEPPLKLVLIEGPEGGTLNHLGVETTDPAEVLAAEARLSADGLATTGVDDTVCCFAEKTETWVSDPDGAPWEWYVKNADADQMSLTKLGDEGATCCAPASSAEPVAFGRPAAAGESSGCC